MGPFRDELGAAHARIAELEAKLEKLGPRAAPVDIPQLIIAAALAGFVGAMFHASPRNASRIVSLPSRTWDGDRLPYDWDDGPGVCMLGDRKPMPARIDCFSGEYQCR